STSHSMTIASRIITPMVRISEIHNGTPSSTKPTTKRPANSTMAPWAKLNTPEALKISTKPSATSAYITPAIRPPIRTSRKNAMSQVPRLMLHAEIGIDDSLVVLDLVRRAITDLAAVIEHHHAVGNIHDHTHIVLDQAD